MKSSALLSTEAMKGSMRERRWNQGERGSLLFIHVWFVCKEEIPPKR
ncbi:hypothetical protein COLO4_12272 [Corchorus olitorius]|uniref:Uncharacterized protein n=1 Tax=Corchorus olitorius TaxID=93759 RepID=A0A1R3K1E4_9ROSI|nr:hypothetical protein COLO4_12272 [Corchorus olitorius]